MYFRQVVWQVVIKIVIGKKQSEGKKTSNKNNSCFCCNTFKRASYSCIHLLGYRYSFFYSKVQGVQDTVSPLLICQSPHRNAFVNSRAADVHRSLSLGVGISIFPCIKVFPFQTCMKLDIPLPLCFFLIWLHCLHYQENMQQSQWNEASCSSGLMFINLKSFRKRVAFIW